MSELLVTMEHVREASNCSSGTRYWFKRYDLDWSNFLKNGIPADKIVATGDSMGLRVVEVARRGRK